MHPEAKTRTRCPDKCQFAKGYYTAPHCSALLCTALHCSALHCTVLYCTVLYCTVLYCTVLYCTVLYCTVLYCTVLYCTVLGSALLWRYSHGQTKLLQPVQACLRCHGRNLIIPWTWIWLGPSPVKNMFMTIPSSIRTCLLIPGTRLRLRPSPL
jgi:hypothetical protein